MTSENYLKANNMRKQTRHEILIIKNVRRIKNNGNVKRRSTGI